jgi:CelD/BcsL family acetyltransferase involved in cellulose biosynthesis
MLMENGSLVRVEMQAVWPDGLHVLTSLGQMDEARHMWKDLDHRSTADLVWFQSFDWCYNWMRQLGQHQQAHVLMLVEKSNAIAVLPLMQGRNRLGVQILRILGEPHSQYGNILTENGTLSHAQRQMFEAALNASHGIDALVCNYVPEDSVLEQVMGKARRLARLDNQSLWVDLAKFTTADAYEASLSKNAIKNLRRRRKHLDDMGPVTFSVLRPQSIGYDAAVADCIAMKQQWLTKTGRVGLGLQKTGHAAFLQCIPNSAGEGPLAFVLSVGGKAAAIELGFWQRSHYYSYIGAFAWDLRQQAPGRLQMHETMRWLIGQGATNMDLLANPTDYKRDIASNGVSLVSLSKSHSFKGALYASLWTGWGKPQLKRAIAAIPERWRAGFNQISKMELSTKS